MEIIFKQQDHESDALLHLLAAYLMTVINSRQLASTSEDIQMLICLL